MSSPGSEKPRNIFGRARGLYHEFSPQFWVVVLGTFIDRLGGAILFPFFTLYLTRRFSIGMTEVGIIFGVFAISGVIGSMVGGALTDRLGRKGMLLFGLVMSALAHLMMGFIGSIELFFALVLIVGVLAETGGPAQQALVADLLPEEKRAQGFGILRVVVNLSVTIGPIIGGLLASRSYLLLFIFDALFSTITALIVYFVLRETRLPKAEGEHQESLAQTFGGYFTVLRDSAFTWFMGASILMVLVYMNMNTTLAVFLRDNHGISEQGFGYILSLNAIMVVLFQFSITRWVNRFQPLIIMAAGTFFYALGFAMYGFVSTYFLFLVAMVIITIGEMMVSPVGQAIVARLAPEDMRGRYMATYGFSWVIPTAIGPLLAGVVMDNFNPNWVWYGAGLLGIAAALAYYFLHWRVANARWSTIDRRLDIMEKVEQGLLSAQEAGKLLESIGEGAWARLTPVPVQSGHRHMRIRVSDLATGTMKVDLRLPMGLINTVLYVGGHLTPDLDGDDARRLHEILAHSDQGQHAKSLDTGDDRVEVSVE